MDLTIKNKYRTIGDISIKMHRIGKVSTHNYSIVVINAVFRSRFPPSIKTMRIKGK